MIYHITYKNNRKYATPVKNREEFLALRNSKENLENLAKARTGDSEAKGRLVQFAYNLGHVSGALAGCKSIGSYFFHDIDCYDQSESEALAKHILAKKDEIGLMFLEKSASGGFHAVCKRMPGTTILENQVKIANILKIEMDTNTKDLQRVAYGSSGSPEDLLYLDDVLFTEPMSAEECEAEYARLKERERRGEEQVPPGAKKARKHYKPWEDEDVSSRPSAARGEISVSSKGDVSTTLDMTSLDERIRFIADAVLKAKNLERSDFLDIGGRHSAVKIFLSGANQLLSKEEANGVLAELMPEHWADKNIQDCVRDFYDKYYNPTQKLTKDQEGIYTESRRLGGGILGQGQAAKPSANADEQIEQMPEMPSEKKLPKLIRLLTRNTPAQYKAAVAHAVFPPLGTHLKEVSFEYTDYVQHEATLMNCLMAHTGAGKGCIDEPIRHIMADIKRRDEENTRREAEWKKDCQKKGANKDKQVRPEGLVIQEIDPDMTKPALVTRMDEAEGHFVYVKLNEIDLFEQLKGQTGKQHFQLMCLAFDPGAEFGQTRIGTQSVTARPK